MTCITSAIWPQIWNMTTYLNVPTSIICVCLKYSGPSVNWIPGGPENFGPNVAQYLPLKLLLQYIIIIIIIIVIYCYIRFKEFCFSIEWWVSVCYLDQWYSTFFSAYPQI
jgi:hypothetical protein